MYREHKKEEREKQAAAVKDDEKKKPGVLQKRNSNLDFRLTTHDFDLKTILDRRTQTHRGSGHFSSLGLDNMAFQMEEGDANKGKQYH